MYLGGEPLVGGPEEPTSWHEAPFRFLLFCRVCGFLFVSHCMLLSYFTLFVVSYLLKCKEMFRFPRVKVPCPLLHFFFFLPIFHVTHHVTGLDQWKHSWIGWWTRAEVLSFTRFCSISWGIFCLLVAFISLAIMGWCSLFTKRLVM